MNNLYYIVITYLKKRIIFRKIELLFDMDIEFEN